MARVLTLPLQRLILENDPEIISAVLQAHAVEPPTPWLRYAQLAASLGAELVAVDPWPSEYEISYGVSPGGCWAYHGGLYVDKGSDAQCTVLHEISHWLTSKNRGTNLEVNFGPEAEAETCDAQVTWVLAHDGPNAAAEVARFLNFGDDDDDDWSEVVRVGMREWAQQGVHLVIAGEAIRTLDRVWHAGYGAKLG